MATMGLVVQMIAYSVYVVVMAKTKVMTKVTTRVTTKVTTKVL